MSLERLTAKLKGRSGAARMLSSYYPKPRFFSDDLRGRGSVFYLYPLAIAFRTKARLLV